MEIKQEIYHLKSKIKKILDVDYPRLKSSDDYKSKKEDRSWVTTIDHMISELVVQHFESKGLAVLSEESEKKELNFPTIIVDPIDGTRELVHEIPEFCVSFSFFNSPSFDDPKNFSWIYNPVTGFEIFSDQIVPRHPMFISDAHLRGFISRNNYSNEISKRLLEHDLFVSPFGSIALKIGMLAAGACNFIYSFREKSIWDIAAGTHMTHLAGFKCLSNGKEITQLESIDIEGPLLWARAEHIEKIEEVLCRKDGK